jgi:transposase-like protein
MEGTKLPLPKWFLAMNLILNAKKGISSLQLSRDIGVNKNTAWFLQKRIREAMDEGNHILKGIVETDESYVGGSLVNKHEKYKQLKQYNKSGMEHKTPVLGMLERKGKIVVKVLNKALGKEIKPIMKKTIAKESDLVTDGFGGYKDLGKHYNQHIILNHTKKIRRIGVYHTNSIEGFWSMLKRAIMGQYHKINPEHLQEYLNELAFKYNHRNNEYAFEVLINNCLKPTMPYSRKWL